MGFFGIVGISIAVSNIAMAIIMLNGGKNKINTIWALFCICVSMLGVSLYYIADTHVANTALTWWKVAYLGVANLPVLILHTTLLMVGNSKKSMKILLYIAYIITFIFNVLNVTGILISHVTYLFDEIYFDTPYSIYFALFFLFFNILFGVIFDLLIHAYRDPLRIDKKSILWFALGIFIGVIGGGALFFPVFGLNIYPYTSILTGVYPLIIGFAILNHRLFDTKYAFLQLLKIITVSTISIVAVIGLVKVLSYFFGYSHEINFIEVFVSSVFIGLSIFLYKNKRIGDIFLLESLRDLEKESKEFLERKGVFQDMKSLIGALEDFFWKGIRVRKVCLIEENASYKYPHITKYFFESSSSVLYRDMGENSYQVNLQERSFLLKEVEELGEVVLSIKKTGEGAIAFLVIGKKESEKPFKSEEVKIMEGILPKISLALQILDFNHALQNQVRIHTKVLAKKNNELKKTYAKLKEVDQNKDNFLAIASHELRTPMTIIKGYADLFMKNTFGPMTDDELRYMKKIYDNTESLIEFVNNLLDISKIEAGKMDIKFESIDPVSVIKDCIDDFSDIYHEKNIGIHLTDESSQDIIKTDKSKLYLILSNLLSNAYKFTSSGGKVEVRVWKKKRNLQVSVSDTGIGMSKDELGHIFEKFSQSNNNNYIKKSIRGTGLGLNLSRQIIEMLGGTITVHSEESKGSCFIFSLPL